MSHRPALLGMHEVDPMVKQDGAEVSVTIDQDDIRFNVPLCTVAEAARALGVPPSTLATWAKGYRRSPQDRRPTHGEPIVTSTTSEPGQPSIPFVGLAEATVLAGIRRSGVLLRNLDRIVTACREPGPSLYAVYQNRIRSVDL